MQNQTNNNLPLEQRIINIVHNEGFRQFCVRENEKNYFMTLYPVFFKLAHIDTKKININKSMFDFNYNPDQVHNETVKFYEWLDSLCPAMPLADASKNLKQIVTYDQSVVPEHARQDKPRAGCGHIVDNGQIVKAWIFLENKSDIRDALSSPHEYGHAHSKHFLTGKPFADPAMGEFVPVMIDELSLHFLELKTGNEKLASEIRKSRINLCVEKARLCVLQYFIVSTMAENIPPQEKLKKLASLKAQYSHIISDADLQKCVKQIETQKFEPLFEARYIFAQLASMELASKLQKIREIKKSGTPEQIEIANQEEQKIVTTLKQVLSRDTELSIDEAISMFGFPPKEVMIENYSTLVSGQAKQTN